MIKASTREQETMPYSAKSDANPGVRPCQLYTAGIVAHAKRDNVLGVVELYALGK